MPPLTPSALASLLARLLWHEACDAVDPDEAAYLDELSARADAMAARGED